MQNKRTNYVRGGNLLLVFTLVAMTAYAIPASATQVYHLATGDQLAGATLTVTWASGATTAAVIGTGPAAQEGSVTVAGAFSFSVVGDTWYGPWSLTNLKPDDCIVMADFFLPPSISLFDDGSSPSTYDSASGRQGAVWVAGPAIIASWEYAPWPDAQNLGDMYLGEIIEWEPCTFPYNTTCDWEDDTDYVPEPATICLLGLGGLALLRKRRP